MLFALFLLLPVFNQENAMAASGGIFHGQAIDTTTTAKMTSITDGSNTTGDNLRNSPNPLFRFQEPTKILKYYQYGYSCMRFYSDAGRTKLIKEVAGHYKTGTWTNLVVDNVMAIQVSTCGVGADLWLYEMDFIAFEPIDYLPVTFLKYTKTYNSINLNWTNPVGKEFTGILIKYNNQPLVNLDSTVSSFSIKNLKAETDYTYEVFAKYSDGTNSIVQTIHTRTDIAPVVANLKATTKHDSAELTWSLPNVTDNTFIRIMQNGNKIIDLDKKETKYNIVNLDPEKNYKYDVVVVYNGYESLPVRVSFTTPSKAENAGEVIDLSAAATHERVDLSWTLPEKENLKHVNIYREKKASWFATIGVETAYAASTKIFETNGTYFNDLTVTADTKYEYTVTTETTSKVESDGATVQIQTSKVPPKDVIEGGGWEQDQNGDFLYTWSKPNTGKVKVLVGGKEYATVNASNLQILIPKEDMVYNLFGKPNVTLIPISDQGVEGEPSKPPSGGGSGSGGNGSGGGGSGSGSGNGGNGDIELPFTVIDFIKGTFELMRLFDKYILLALAILLFPLFTKILKRIFSKK